MDKSHAVLATSEIETSEFDFEGQSIYADFISLGRKFLPRMTASFYYTNSSFYEQSLSLVRAIIEKDVIFALDCVVKRAAEFPSTLFPLIVLAEAILFEERLRERNRTDSLLFQAVRGSYGDWRARVTDCSNLRHSEISRHRLRSRIKEAATLLLHEPALMADLLAYFIRETGLSIKDVPSYIKKRLGKILEAYPYELLLKRHRRRRDVSVADMIKVLHVRGRTPAHQDIFRQILANA